MWRGGGKEGKFGYQASSAEVTEEAIGVVRRGVEGGVVVVVGKNYLLRE